MHPYVYKKQYKLHQLIALVILYYIMILSQPVNSSCPNFAVKKIKIYSEFSKGYVRIDSNRVVATECKEDNCDQSENFLYKVTIDKHYMLLYHIQSKKFICWNKGFKKLVAKRNPANLTYCKFEDKLSKIKDYQGSKIRYTTKNDKGSEVEMRFNNKGFFAKPNGIFKCVKKHKLHHKLSSLTAKKFVELDPAEISEGSREMEAYKLLMTRCANPDFLRSDVDRDKCVSGLPDFCGEMKELRAKGHSISSEIMELCKNEWKRN